MAANSSGSSNLYACHHHLFCGLFNALVDSGEVTAHFLVGLPNCLHMSFGFTTTAVAACISLPGHFLRQLAHPVGTDAQLVHLTLQKTHQKGNGTLKKLHAVCLVNADF